MRYTFSVELSPQQESSQPVYTEEYQPDENGLVWFVEESESVLHARRALLTKFYADGWFAKNLTLQEEGTPT